jgi:hypothetical protein
MKLPSWQIRTTLLIGVVGPPLSYRRGVRRWRKSNWLMFYSVPLKARCWRDAHSSFVSFSAVS